MCGICGQYNYKTNKSTNKQIIKKMADSIYHRGPDDEGYYFSNNLGLGFRRLSIIDLQGGHQPMASSDKEVWVVFNGEIYNFPELKTELESYGYEFQTKSDTEVIIYGYRHWGIDVFNHLNGMFGLAIWDEKSKQLILSRDRMGIKLIYYKIDNDGITFGSEIRAINAVSTVKPEIDPESLNLFLRYRYTPSPLTIFKDIYKLAPGTCLIINNNECRKIRWWKYKPEPISPVPDLNDAKEELLTLYKKSMKRHLISDVPVGLLLSGGVDSAMLLALMNEFGKNWQTFTIGFGKGYSDDELNDAGETARILNMPNKRIQIDRDIFEQSFSKVISFLEEPIASASIIPMYHLCKHTSDNVKTALVGQGPDELFGGYKRHLGVRYGYLWRKIPFIFRYPVKCLINRIPRSEALKRSMFSLDLKDKMQRYQHVFSLHSGQVIDGMFKEGIINKNTGDKVLNCWSELNELMERTDELGGFQFIEIRSSLPDELLMYADKLSMAHSLELRVPYLDKEIVEYVERLPSSFKIRLATRKYLHKEVCKNYLPKTIINRKKRAFSSNVVDDWFNSSMDSRINNYLSDSQSKMFAFLDYSSVQKLFRDHQTKKDNNYKILFSLVVFEEWLRTVY